MIHVTLSVYDSKANSYGPPFNMKTTGEAIRAFSDSINGQESMLTRHPADFTLYEIGTFDDYTGRFDQAETYNILGTGNQFRVDPEPIYEPSTDPTIEETE